MEKVVSAKPEIEFRTKKIIIEKLGIENTLIPDNASFVNDLGIDSLDLCEIFMTAEKEFDIKIPDEDAEKLLTVGSLINYIKNKN